MKRTLVALASLICSSIAYGQSTKGMSVPKPAESKVEGKTYALVVGVSRYKNPAIPQLEYADRDAVAFRNYLVSAGVDSNNVTLLLNEKATNGEFWANIGLLTDLAKPGDKVFIYFSGHGDVENKTVVKDAYLLPYDAPKCVYPAGAIAVVLLKSWIASLSANGIQAIFIADACRSGNLAGGREGMEAAAAMLKDKWQDEIKILSCQPGELSLEGKQWGGGRGLFSYELVNGMAGMADKNKDGKVTLRELSLYMMDKVPEEANPSLQNPALFGSPETVVSIVTPATQRQIITGETKMLASAGTKGFEESLLAGLDDSIKYNYKLFKDSLKRVNYSGLHYVPAYKFYCAIPDDDKTHLLKTVMKRDLCSELMTDAQYSLDKQLDNRLEDSHVYRRLWYSMGILRDILGVKKLDDLGFLPKLYLFEAVPMLFSSKDTSICRAMIRKLDSAISLAPNAAYLYAYRGYFLNKRFNDENAAIADYRKSIQLSPRFFGPYDDLFHIFREKGQLDSCYYYALKTVELSTTTNDSMHSLYSLACYYSLANRKSDATDYLNKAVDLGFTYFPMIIGDPDLDNIRNTAEFQNLMGKHFPYASAQSYAKRKDTLKAIMYLTKSLERESMVISHGLTDPQYTSEFGSNDRFKMLQQIPDPAARKATAIAAFYQVLQTDTNLANIRSTAEYKALMKQYFPDQYKE